MGIPDGVNVAYSNGGTISQVLSATLTPGTYTLLVDIGSRLDEPLVANGGVYIVELLAGGTILAEDNNTLKPAPGTFLTSTVTYTASANDPLLGQSLEIRLVNPIGAAQNNYDDVRLSLSSVPEPTSVLLLGIASCFGLLARKWLFRRGNQTWRTP